MRAIILLIIFLFPISIMANTQTTINNYQDSQENNRPFQLNGAQCYDENGENIPVSECVYNSTKAASLWINGVLYANICRSKDLRCFMHSFYSVGTKCYCPHFYNGQVTTY